MHTLGGIIYENVLAVGESSKIRSHYLDKMLVQCKLACKERLKLSITTMNSACVIYDETHADRKEDSNKYDKI